MVHVLSASVLCEHNIITARGSVNACRGCHDVFEGFHFRHYFPPTCRNSTCFYGCTLLISFLGYDLGSPEPNKGTPFRSKLIMLVAPGACERVATRLLASEPPSSVVQFRKQNLK